MLRLHYGIVGIGWYWCNENILHNRFKVPFKKYLAFKLCYNQVPTNINSLAVVWDFKINQTMEYTTELNAMVMIVENRSSSEIRTVSKKYLQIINENFPSKYFECQSKPSY